MRNRYFWFRKIDECWQRRSVVWLSGVPLTGKSSILQNLPQVEYFDCSLPSVRRMLEHPSEFLSSIGEGRVALDCISEIVNAKLVLQTARKEYPQIRLIVADNKPSKLTLDEQSIVEENIEELWLTPMTANDLLDFQTDDLQTRFLRGGLPAFFTSDNLSEYAFQQWLNEFWFKSIHDSFRLERRASMQKLSEDLFANSGQIFEATKYAPNAAVSRTTITNYLAVLEKTYLVNLLKPFNSRRSTEIIAAPKVYGFDTGFVAFHRGWSQLRRSDLNPMWEHFVLNELHAQLQTRQFYYWKDKRNHQVSFIFARRIHTPTAIECAWSTSEFDPSGLQAFRRQYPHGESIVVCHDVTQPFTRTFKQITARFLPLNQLVDVLIS